MESNHSSRVIILYCAYYTLINNCDIYVQGLGTNDRVLVRVMVSRCEVDMVQIKKVFYQKYHKTLGSFIKVGETMCFTYGDSVVILSRIMYCVDVHVHIWKAFVVL